MKQTQRIITNKAKRRSKIVNLHKDMVIASFVMFGRKVLHSNSILTALQTLFAPIFFATSVPLCSLYRFFSDLMYESGMCISFDFKFLT